jgi:hypothetical protein
MKKFIKRPPRVFVSKSGRLYFKIKGKIVKINSNLAPKNLVKVVINNMSKQKRKQPINKLLMSNHSTKSPQATASGIITTGLQIFAVQDQLRKLEDEAKKEKQEIKHKLQQLQLLPPFQNMPLPQIAAQVLPQIAPKSTVPQIAARNLPQIPFKPQLLSSPTKSQVPPQLPTKAKPSNIIPPSPSKLVTTNKNAAKGSLIVIDENGNEKVIRKSDYDHYVLQPIKLKAEVDKMTGERKKLISDLDNNRNILKKTEEEIEHVKNEKIRLQDDFENQKKHFNQLHEKIEEKLLQSEKQMRNIIEINKQKEIDFLKEEQLKIEKSMEEKHLTKVQLESRENQIKKIEEERKQLEENNKKMQEEKKKIEDNLTKKDIEYKKVRVHDFLNLKSTSRQKLRQLQKDLQIPEEDIFKPSTKKSKSNKEKVMDKGIDSSVKPIKILEVEILKKPVFFNKIYEYAEAQYQEKNPKKVEPKVTTQPPIPEELKKLLEEPLSLENAQPLTAEQEETLKLFEEETPPTVPTDNKADDLAKKDLSGSGIGGLYSSEIEKMMQPFHKYGFKGVISLDQIQSLITKVHQGEYVSFIMNLDPSSKPGSHWVAVYINPNESLEYFDSFGRDPPPSFNKDILQLINKIKPTIYLKEKINRIVFQSTSSQECGFFAMKFLIDRYKGIPFKECTGYNDSKKGEQDIQKFKKKFEEFKYI